MNAHSMIPHRMFVAALSGGRPTTSSQSSPPLPLHVELAAPASSALLEDKRRSEAVSSIAMRQVFEMGARLGV